jgi:AAA ATPase domain
MSAAWRGGNSKGGTAAPRSLTHSSFKASTTTNGRGSGSGNLQFDSLDLCGRESEVQQLDNWFQDCCANRSSSSGTTTMTLVAVSGKAGVGKSSFILSLQDQWKKEPKKTSDVVVLPRDASSTSTSTTTDPESTTGSLFFFAMGTFPQTTTTTRCTTTTTAASATTTRTSTSSSSNSSSMANGASSSAAASVVVVAPPMTALRDAILDLLQQWSSEIPNAKEEMIEFAKTCPDNATLLYMAIPHLCEEYGIFEIVPATQAEQQQQQQDELQLVQQQQQQHEQLSATTSSQPRRLGPISAKSLLQRTFAKHASNVSSSFHNNNKNSSSLLSSSSSSSGISSSLRISSSSSASWLRKSDTITTTASTSPVPRQPQRTSTIRMMSGIEGCTIHSYKASMKRLLTFLCRPDRPIVLVLDNVHSADAASWDMIQFLCSCHQEFPALMLILSYRDEDDDTEDNTEDDTKNDHDNIQQEDRDALLQAPPPPRPLNTVRSMLQSILQQTKTTTSPPLVLHRLPLSNLTVTSVNIIVSKVTERDTEATMPLSRVIHQKTLGNPYHVLQLLQQLVEEGFLTFSLIQYRWEWGNTNDDESSSIPAIAASLKVSSNVSEWLASRMERTLSMELKQVLMVASCLGDSIPSMIVQEVFQDLQQQQQQKLAIQDDKDDDDVEEWWLQLGDNSPFTLDPEQVIPLLELGVQGGILNHCAKTYLYQWSHEQLQTVAYDMIDSALLGPLHSRLGKLLWDLSSRSSHSSSPQHSPSRVEEKEWMIYMAADQFNKASVGFGDRGTCVSVELATLNLQAAKLSIAQSAFYPARESEYPHTRYLFEKVVYLCHKNGDPQTFRGLYYYCTCFIESTNSKRSHLSYFSFGPSLLLHSPPLFQCCCCCCCFCFCTQCYEQGFNDLMLKPCGMRNITNSVWTCLVPWPKWNLPLATTRRVWKRR